MAQVDMPKSSIGQTPTEPKKMLEKVVKGKIEGYQIIIPTTWNMAPINQNGVHGPIEQSLIGCPVEDIEKPINALRTVHSYDPCVSCAVHISEPATGKHFETVTNPWGVK